MKQRLNFLTGLIPVTLILLLSFTSLTAQQKQWSYVKDKIVTPWAEKVDPKAPLPEYPSSAVGS